MDETFFCINSHFSGLTGPRGRTGKPGKDGSNGIPAVCLWKVKVNDTLSNELLIPPSIASKIRNFIIIKYQALNKPQLK